MAERTDFTTIWGLSPRIIEIAAPSSSLLVQDLHDTLKSNTEQASENDDSLENLDDDPVIDSEGKAGLGGSLETGITARMLNSQVAFEGRTTPTSSGSATAASVNGAETITLEDTSATFVTDGVTRGATLINFGDESVTEVLTVVDEQNLILRPLRAGNNNDFGIGDNYKIWNIVQCTVDQGNVVGVDALNNELSPFFPTAFTQIVYAKSTEAAAISQTELVAQLAVILADFGLDISQPKTVTENTPRESYDEEVAGVLTKEIRKVGNVTTITRTS